MRRSLYAAVAVATMAAGSLAPGQALAFGLLGTPQASNSVEQVRLVCTRVWDGYGYVRQCREVYDRPRYYSPRYYAPPPPPPPVYYRGYGY